MGTRRALPGQPIDLRALTEQYPPRPSNKYDDSPRPLDKGVSRMAEAYANLPSERSRRESVLTAWAKRHPYASLVFLVFLFEWIYMLPALADSKGLISFHGPVVDVLGFVDGWGPGLA